MALARILRTILALIVVFVFIFLLALAIYLFLGSKYNQKIFPGIRLDNINLQGKTASEAKDLIYAYIDTIDQDGIVFEYKNKATIIYPIKSYSPDGDLIETLIDFNVDKTVADAMAIGRSGNFVPDLLNRFSLLVGRRVELVANLNRDKIIERLDQGFAGIVPTPAKFYIDQGKIAIKPASDGKLLSYSDGLDELDYNLKRFVFSAITLTDAGDGKANILEEDCVKVEDQAKALVDLAPIRLKYKGRNVGSVDANTLADWINVSKSASTDNNPVLSLDLDKINKYLDEYVEIQIDEEPVLPKFTFKNGVLQKVRSAKSGLELDMSLAADMLASLPANQFRSLDLSVRKMPIADLKADANFGIKEKIGGSSSAIIESSDNRIKNIKNGVSAVNGLLLAPGEEFSLLSVLRPFNEENGYVKEIVIGSNGFTPDYGGGLCQLSTTVFRAAIDTGLPITMRRNHSYWLHYYNPPGTDATIFEPTPDLRFVNDTGKYILMQANVDEKLNLNIEFWGTKDGRVVTRTEPVVYNIVDPVGAKTIKTTSLATGVTKCQYDSYKGADAYFDYKVVYPNGDVKEQRFSSHYIPKPKTCYVGI